MAHQCAPCPSLLSADAGLYGLTILVDLRFSPVCQFSTIYECLGRCWTNTKHNRHLFMDHYVSRALGVGYFSKLHCRNLTHSPTLQSLICHCFAAKACSLHACFHRCLLTSSIHALRVPAICKSFCSTLDRPEMRRKEMPRTEIH